jgi:hypothetical protein
MYRISLRGVERDNRMKQKKINTLHELPYIRPMYTLCSNDLGNPAHATMKLIKSTVLQMLAILHANLSLC